MKTRSVRRALAVTAVCTVGLGGLALWAPTAQADAPVLISTTGTTWKYLDNNTDPAEGLANRTDWTLPAFDDAAWSSATGSFGSKNGTGTTLTGGYVAHTKLNQYITGTTDIPAFFFRTKVTISAVDLAAASSFDGSVVYDDAATVYVNGVKVAGFDDGSITANMQYGGSNADVPKTGTFSIPASAFVVGENTVAVEIHNGRADSSDVYFELPSLTETLAPTTPASPISDVILGVGADEAQRMVSWYSDTNATETLEVATDAGFTANVVNFPATLAANVSATTAAPGAAYNGTATITGLQEDTTYYYRVGDGSTWTPAYSFRTQDFEGDFDFLFFGDPQIGSSGDIASDTAGWSHTLDVALGANPDAELLVSGGDQVDSANNEAQWDGFLAPAQLKSVPWLATIGNHDVGGKAYEQHLHTPNTLTSAAVGGGSTSATNSGGDYFTIYKDVLFIDLNSNLYTGSSDPAHLAYVTQVVNEHPNVKYKVLVFHHSIYSPASHANDAQNQTLADDFTTAFSDLGVDLVLQGHDHSYSRSYEIKNGAKANPEETPGQQDVFVGPGGVIYLTANSASGSKYYALTDPSTTARDGKYGPDPDFPTSLNDAGKQRHWANSVESQENKTSYVQVSVQHDQLVVKDIRSQVSGGNAEGTLIDSVTIHPYHGSGSQTVQVDVAGGAAGEFGWSIAGANGLVSLGTAEDNGTYLTATGAINPIVVTDTRKPKPAWTLQAQAGDFADGDKHFSGGFLGWVPSVLAAGAGAVPGDAVTSTADGGQGLSTARTLGYALLGHAKGSATLGAQLNLRVPSETTEKGDYRSTLTISAVS